MTFPQVVGVIPGWVSENVELVCNISTYFTQRNKT